MGEESEWIVSLLARVSELGHADGSSTTHALVRPRCRRLADECRPCTGVKAVRFSIGRGVWCRRDFRILDRFRPYSQTPRRGTSRDNIRAADSCFRPPAEPSTVTLDGTRPLPRPSAKSDPFRILPPSPKGLFAPPARSLARPRLQSCLRPSPEIGRAHV